MSFSPSGLEGPRQLYSLVWPLEGVALALPSLCPFGFCFPFPFGFMQGKEPLSLPLVGFLEGLSVQSSMFTWKSQTRIYKALSYSDFFTRVYEY